MGNTISECFRTHDNDLSELKNELIKVLNILKNHYQTSDLYLYLDEILDSIDKNNIINVNIQKFNKLVEEYKSDDIHSYYDGKDVTPNLLLLKEIFSKLK